MSKNYLKVAIKAAETSGDIIIDYFEKLHDFKQKNQNIRDLVTEVDILSEKNIKQVIGKAFPSHAINAEESPLTGSADLTWHIDPLDGTVNYSQGIPICAVSVALEEKGEIIAGVIFNPFSQELYFASKGNGAYLNGKPINVSKKKNFTEGIYVAAFSAASSKEKEAEYKVYGKVNDATRGVLRLGSAAVALGYLAAGRIDGFWAKNLFPWDLAAGIVLINEAGGKVSSQKGKRYSFNDPIIVASNGLIHKELLSAVVEL